MELEKSSRLDPTTQYPLIVKSSHCQTKQPCITSPPASIHPSAFTMSVSSRIPRQLPPPIPNRGDHHSTVSLTSPFFNMSLQDMKWKCVPDLAWCVKGGEGKFLVLFHDGISMMVEARKQTLEWMDTRNSSLTVQK